MPDANITPESGLEPSQPHGVPARKPWHAPQFIQTDIADTDTQGGAPSDSPLGQS
jgi:hypothetical protein